MAVNIQFDIDDPKIRALLLDLAADYAKKNGGRAATSRVVKDLLMQLLNSGSAQGLLGLEQPAAESKKGKRGRQAQ